VGQYQGRERRKDEIGKEKRSRNGNGKRLVNRGRDGVIEKDGEKQTYRKNMYNLKKVGCKNEKEKEKKKQ
jgi:hypothetical protein